MKFTINNKNTNKLTFNDKLNIINYKNIKYKNLNEFKKELSNDENYIPLFDSVNEKIRLVHKTNIFNLIKNNNFRVLNEKLLNFLKINNYDQKIIDLVNLFDFNILEENLLKFVFYNSEEIYSDVSYLINPAYIKYLDISPYLKKSAIINTGLNANIIKVNELPIKEEKIEEIYSKIKNLLFDKYILESHNKIINKNKAANLIRYYTFLGNIKINNYLRKIYEFNDDITFKQIKQLYKLFDKTEKLKEDKIIFRFVKDDSFLNVSKIGDVYKSNSFMSCTRKPNISSNNNEFGFILLKVRIPKNSQGNFLAIETNSVFSNEKEILLKPGVKLKLLSLDDDVDFYLFENNFLRNIKKKYEFEIIGSEEMKITTLPKKDIPIIDFNSNLLNSENLEDVIENFMKNNNFVNKSFYLKYGNKKKLCYVDFYDSTTLYSKFFYYKSVNGLFIYSFNEDNILDLFVEVGDFLIVNYPNEYLRIEETDDLKLISSVICRYFQIGSIKIFPKYIIFNEIINSENDLYKLYAINELLYKIINNSYIEEDIYKYNFITEFLDSLVNFDNLNFNLIDFKKDNVTYKQLFKMILKKDVIFLKYYLMSLPSLIKNCHYEFYPYEYLVNENIISFTPVNFSRFNYPNDKLYDELSLNVKINEKKLDNILIS